VNNFDRIAYLTSLTALIYQGVLFALFPDMFIKNETAWEYYYTVVSSLYEPATASLPQVSVGQSLLFKDQLAVAVDFIDPVVSTWVSFSSRYVAEILQASTFLGFTLLLWTFLHNYLENSKLSFSLLRLSTFFKQSVFVNFSFMLSREIVIFFSFFFLVLYFLEFHFFFVYSSGGSSDSFIYQFNFLATSFLLIFLVKLSKNVYSENIFFFVVLFVNSNLEYNLKKNVLKLDKGTASGYNNTFAHSPTQYAIKYTITLFFSIFFFLSTFVVWLLRFCIQFIRLLVLFLIHAVFELTIVGSDSYLSGSNQSGFFLFKAVFFCFFYFCSFLYLLVYLNLMFTLQTFIFFFFLRFSSQIFFLTCLL